MAAHALENVGVLRGRIGCVGKNVRKRHVVVVVVRPAIPVAVHQVVKNGIVGLGGLRVALEWSLVELFTRHKCHDPLAVG